MAEEKELDVAPFIGKEGATVPVAYNQRDLLIYALGIGCDEMKFVYENADDFAAFPTYPIVLGFKGDSYDTLSFPSPAMGAGNVTPPLPGVKNGLDGERYMEFVSPIPAAGGQFSLSNKLVSCHPKGKGAAVESEQVLRDAAGKVYVRMVSSAFLVGAKGFKGAGQTQMPTYEKPKRNPDAVVELKTSINQAVIYRLSGDYNPLHIDNNFAQMFGFPDGPILHGLCTMGHTARAALQAFGDNDPNRLKAFKVRFASPVMPGETLIVNMWKDGATRVVIEVAVKRGGKQIVVVNNSFAEFHAPKAKL